MSDNALAALEHSLHMIEHAKIVTEPYKHLVIDGIFPADYYLQILKHFPDQALMPKSRDDVHQLDLCVDPGVERFADGQLLIENTLKKTEPEKYAFWSDFRDAYFTKRFCDSFLSKFEGNFDERDLVNYQPVGRIACDLKGAGLGPHRDRDDKICSVLFYLGDRFDDELAIPRTTLSLKGWVCTQNFTLRMKRVDRGAIPSTDGSNGCFIIKFRVFDQWVRRDR